MTAFSAGERGRKVEPVWMSRFTMIGRRSMVALAAQVRDLHDAPV